MLQLLIDKAVFMGHTFSPNVVVTDFEASYDKAIENKMPNTVPFKCVFHLLQNVEKKLVSTNLEILERKQFKTLVQALVSKTVKSKKDFQKIWDKMEKDWKQTEVFRYFSKMYGW